MKKFWEDWTTLEKCLLWAGIFFITLFSIIFASDHLTLFTSLAGVICALLQAKGKVISPLVGILEVILYSILSYQNHYYGEVLIDVFIVLPMYIYGVISWMTHKHKQTDTVEPNEISKKEWGILSLLSVVGFLVLYQVLKYFNTSQLMASSLSMITSLMVTYLMARRSHYGFLFYIGNDLILLLLWGSAVWQGDFSLLPILVEDFVMLMNDTYGLKNWSENQKKEEKND